jgi:hypothetical protein
MMSAFKATYSDWKLVKTRQVVQIVFEVPLAEADAAYELLGGMPAPATERWFGIAALRGSEPAKPQPVVDKPPAGAKREKMDWRDMQPAAQCAIRCGEQAFRIFLMEEHEYRPRDKSDPDEAADFIRSMFGINSRTELGTDQRKRVLWNQLDNQFQAWKAMEHA